MAYGPSNYMRRTRQRYSSGPSDPWGSAQSADVEPDAEDQSGGADIQALQQQIQQLQQQLAQAQQTPQAPIAAPPLPSMDRAYANRRGGIRTRRNNPRGMTGGRGTRSRRVSGTGRFRPGGGRGFSGGGASGFSGGSTHNAFGVPYSTPSARGSSAGSRFNTYVQNLR